MPREAVIRAHLESGERLLWTGRPGRLLRTDELAIAAVALAWAVLCAVGFVHEDGSVLAALLGLGGLGVAGWFLLLTPHGRTRLTYSVTDRRVLVVHGGVRPRVEAYALRGMSAEQVIARPARDRGATIGFADFAQRRGYDKADLCMPECIALDDPARTLALIRGAIAAAR